MAHRDQVRDHDIVLFGATGFVGRLTARHLATHAPEGLRIALAGRSAAKLGEVRAGLGGAARDWAVVTADSGDVASLEALASSARVVISTVGPYAKHGLPLVGACAAAGTDYVDLSGEVFFVRDSIDCFDAVAKESGARIVHSCGADSVPSDLGVLITADAARKAGDGELTTVDCYWRVLRGGFSGGTLASMAGDMETRNSSKDRARRGFDPYALSPDRAAEPEGTEARDKVGPGRARSLPGWETLYLLAGFNAQVVRRSNALSGWAYGRGFRYRESLSTGSSLLSPVLAAAFTGVQIGLAAGYSIDRLRPLMDRILPSPGEGPSEASMARGRFLLEFHALTTSGARWVSRVGASKDPGYSGTAVMLGEAALALAAGEGLPERAGVLTPATGIGRALVDRLRAGGFTVTTERVSA